MVGGVFVSALGVALLVHHRLDNGAFFDFDFWCHGFWGGLIVVFGFLMVVVF